MNREWMIDHLTVLGLSEFQAKIYLLLLTQGPQSINNLSKELLASKQLLYRNLAKMNGTFITKESRKRQQVYAAATIGQIFLKSVERNEEEVEFWKNNRETILEVWRRFINVRKEKEPAS